MEKQKRKDVPTIDWLDKLVYRQIEKIYAVSRRSSFCIPKDMTDAWFQEETANSDKLYLYVDLPRFDLPVLYGEHEYALPTLPSLVTSSKPAGMTNAAATIPTTPLLRLSDISIFPVVDPDIARDNPVEAKHLRLVRSHRSGPLDREMKPNASTRDELNVSARSTAQSLGSCLRGYSAQIILDYPPTQPLTTAECNLLWRFRFYLTRDKRALTKFLKSVRWTDRDEVKQAVDVLLPMWSDIEIGDALELLGPGDAFRDRRVRSFAVKQLARADDEVSLIDQHLRDASELI